MQLPHMYMSVIFIGVRIYQTSQSWMFHQQTHTSLHQESRTPMFFCLLLAVTTFLKFGMHALFTESFACLSVCLITALRVCILVFFIKLSSCMGRNYAKCIKKKAYHIKHFYLAAVGSQKGTAISSS